MRFLCKQVCGSNHFGWPSVEFRTFCLFCCNSSCCSSRSFARKRSVSEPAICPGTELAGKMCGVSGPKGRCPGGSVETNMKWPKSKKRWNWTWRYACKHGAQRVSGSRILLRWLATVDSIEVIEDESFCWVCLLAQDDPWQFRAVQSGTSDFPDLRFGSFLTTSWHHCTTKSQEKAVLAIQKDEASTVRAVGIVEWFGSSMVSCFWGFAMWFINLSNKTRLLRPWLPKASQNTSCKGIGPGATWDSIIAEARGSIMF